MAASNLKKIRSTVSLWCISPPERYCLLLHKEIGKTSRYLRRQRLGYHFLQLEILTNFSRNSVLIARCKPGHRCTQDRNTRSSIESEWRIRSSHRLYAYKIMMERSFRCLEQEGK
jgi:hypothetical protein